MGKGHHPTTSEGVSQSVGMSNEPVGDHRGVASMTAMIRDGATKSPTVTRTQATTTTATGSALGPRPRPYPGAADVGLC